MKICIEVNLADYPASLHSEILTNMLRLRSQWENGQSAFDASESNDGSADDRSSSGSRSVGGTDDSPAPSGEKAPAKKNRRKTKKAAPEKEAKPEDKSEAEDTVKPEHLVSVAEKFLSSRGAKSLRGVLSSFGVKRVIDCPPEKRADLLTELSVA